MESANLVLNDIYRAPAFILLYFFLFLLAKWSKDFSTNYSLNEELTKNDNLAVAITMAGYYLATAAIFIGSLLGPDNDLVTELIEAGGYSILGLAFLNMSRFINDQIILRRFSNENELEINQNTAVGAVQFGTYVATGLIAAGAITGTGGIETAIVFFILGQASLLLFTLVYDLVTPFSIHNELYEKNTAAGAALGGTMIALGIIISNGVSGDFISWQADLTQLLIINIFAFICLPIIRFFMDKLVIPGDDLSREIVEDRNLGAGILEGTVAICFGLVISLLI